jgi:hypothetical protein
MKKIYGICILLICSIFSYQVIALGQELFSKELKAIAENYACHEDVNHFQKNEKGTKAPYYWGFLKDSAPIESVVFWCNYRDEDKKKSKIVIHIDSARIADSKETNPFSECPNEITKVIGESTGLWVENDTIYTGFEDGIYYYCKDSKWERSDWH